MAIIHFQKLQKQCGSLIRHLPSTRASRMASAIHDNFHKLCSGAGQMAFLNLPNTFPNRCFAPDCHLANTKTSLIMNIVISAALVWLHDIYWLSKQIATSMIFINLSSVWHQSITDDFWICHLVPSEMPSVPIWNYAEPSGAIWSCLEPSSVATWGHLGPGGLPLERGWVFRSLAAMNPSFRMSQKP